MTNTKTIDIGSMVTNEVISGKKALTRAKMLQNNGCVKRLLNRYIKQELEPSQQSRFINKKAEFVPFVDERDHLGQLLNSDIRTELGGNSYVKKLLHFQPRKVLDKIEIRDDIPRRWLEGVGQQSEIASHQRRLSIGSQPAQAYTEFNATSMRGSNYDKNTE